MGYVLMLVGCTIAAAALFNWSFVMDSDRAGFIASAIGDVALRITLGVLGVILVLVGVDLNWKVF